MEMLRQGRAWRPEAGVPAQAPAVDGGATAQGHALIAGAARDAAAPAAAAPAVATSTAVSSVSASAPASSAGPVGGSAHGPAPGLAPWSPPQGSSAPPRPAAAAPAPAPPRSVDALAVLRGVTALANATQPSDRGVGGVGVVGAGVLALQPSFYAGAPGGAPWRLGATPAPSAGAAGGGDAVRMVVRGAAQDAVAAVVPPPPPVYAHRSSLVRPVSLGCVAWLRQVAGCLGYCARVLACGAADLLANVLTASPRFMHM
jgi:hypothetical protein